MRVYLFWILLFFCSLTNYTITVSADDDDEREIVLVGDKNYSNNSHFIYDGIDVSNYQKDINWEATASDDNIKYVYIKATEGATHKQHRYRYNLENARKHGIKVGSYHFMRTSTSIQSQFNNFISIVKREEQDLIPLLDVETREGWTIKQLQDSVYKFAQLLEQHFGCKPMIYCNSSYFNNYLGSVFAHYPLFIARYSKSEPSLYYGAKWILWQFSDRGRIDGIDALVDLSRFNRGCSLKDITYKQRSRSRRATTREEVPRPKIRHDEKPSVPYPNKYNANVPKTQEQRDVQRRGEEAARKRQEMERKRLEEERKAEEKLRKEEEKKRKEIEKRQKEIEKRRAAEEKKRQEEEKKRLEQEKKRQREEAKQNARRQAQDRMKAEKELAQQHEQSQRQADEQKRRDDLEKAKQERLEQEKRNASSVQSTVTSKPKNTPKGNNQSSADNETIHYNKKKKTVW